MKSLKITNNWDLDIDSNGDFCFVNDYEELLQTACHAVYTFQGEDPFNPNVGIPYFDDILGGLVSKKTLLESYMRYEIRNIDGITNLYLLEDEDILSRISRDFKGTIYITTTDGENNE